MTRSLLVFSVSILVATPAASHHNFAAHYDQDVVVTVSGVVTRFRFVNPHVRVYFDVTDESGETVTWMAEGDASVALRRTGWTPDQLQPGDHIEVVGNPARDGRNMLGWETVRVDGMSIGGGDGRLEERVRILEERLTQYRQERGS